MVHSIMSSMSNEENGTYKTVQEEPPTTNPQHAMRVYRDGLPSQSPIISARRQEIQFIVHCS